jgi:hypothetical protein
VNIQWENLPNAGAGAPKGDGVVPKGVLPEETVVCPKDGEEPKLNVLADVPNEGVLEDPKPGVVLLTPNAVVPEVPKPVEDVPKAVEPNAGVLEAPNKDVDVEPNAGVVDALKAGVVVVPKAGVVVPNAGIVVVPNAGVVDEPKVLLPNVGCVCWNVLPKGFDWLGDDPKPPKLGFCPNKDPITCAEQRYDITNNTADLVRPT